MKKTLLFGIFAVVMCSMIAQNFDLGNAWYSSNPNRPFVKLSTGQTGIYRVSLQDLQNTQFDANVNANSLQLFHRGVQVPIYIATNPANPTQLAYFDFLGEQNDGRDDSVMYRDPLTGAHNPNLQPTKQVSIFSDSAAYFLTWGNGNALPFSNFTSSNYTNPLPTFWYETAIIPHINNTGLMSRGGGSLASILVQNHFLNSDYITGEGWILVQGDFSAGSPRTFNLPTKYPTNNPANPTSISMRVFGKSDGTHQIQAYANGTSLLMADTMSTIFIKSYNATYTGSINTSTNNLPIKFQANGTVDNNGVCWLSAIYERNANGGMDNASFFTLKNWDKTTQTYLEIPNVAGNNNVYVYDFKNKYRHEGILQQQTLKCVIYGNINFQNTDLYVVTDAGLKTPKIEDAIFSNLHVPIDGGAEFVIITHRDFSNSAQAYRDYRDSATVNQIAGKVIYTDEIYNEYGYGTFTPWAIKRFCKDAFDNWATKPKYILLWGKARNTTTNFATVPGICYPLSDYEFVNHYDASTYDLSPRAAIGRVNITSDQEGLAYLAKVDEYEHTAWNPSWMKHAVFLGGGNNPNEQAIIQNTLLRAINTYESAPYGGLATYMQKGDTLYNDTSYHQRITDGVNWIHFFGHASSNIFDVDIREPNEYENGGQYPFIFAEGCYAGEYGAGTSFGEKWISEPQKGAIGYLANTGIGYAPELSTYSDSLYRYVFNKMIGERMGDAIKKTFDQYLLVGNSQMYRNHARQINLQGDPSLRLYMPPSFVGTENGTDFAENIIVFPNPTNTVLNIVFSKEITGNEQIAVYDMLGKRCKSLESKHYIGKKACQISVSDLTKGMYILQVKSNEKNETQRFCVE